MATTAEEAFSVFLSWLAPRDEERLLAARRRAIVEPVARHLGARGVLDAGSFSRGTAVHQVSGADYFLWLPSRNPFSAQKALAGVRKAVEAVTPSVQVRVRRPGVVLEFGPHSPSLTLIPAYAPHKVIGEDVTFRIPGVGREDWLRINPAAQREWLDGCQRRSGARGSVTGLSRLAKAWQNYRGVPLSRFYLEVRAAAFMAERDSVAYPREVRRFFAALVEDGLEPVPDPAGPGMVHACPDEEARVFALTQLANAEERAGRALSEQQVGTVQRSFEHWSRLFGGAFPAYH